MRCVDFIYVGNLQKRDRFIENYRLLFLYAPDEVVRGVNEILDAMTSNKPQDDEAMKAKKKKIAESMLTLRKQFERKTKLSPDDFRHVT